MSCVPVGSSSAGAGLQAVSNDGGRPKSGSPVFRGSSGQHGMSGGMSLAQTQAATGPACRMAATSTRTSVLAKRLMMRPILPPGGGDAKSTSAHQRQALAGRNFASMNAGGVLGLS